MVVSLNVQQAAPKRRLVRLCVIRACRLISAASACRFRPAFRAIFPSSHPLRMSSHSASRRSRSRCRSQDGERRDRDRGNRRYRSTRSRSRDRNRECRSRSSHRRRRSSNSQSRSRSRCGSRHRRSSCRKSRSSRSRSARPSKRSDKSRSDSQMRDRRVGCRWSLPPLSASGHNSASRDAACDPLQKPVAEDQQQQLPTKPVQRRLLSSKVQLSEDDLLKPENRWVSCLVLVSIP